VSATVQKRRLSHDLERIKELISKKRCKVTITAEQFGGELGFSASDIQDVVLELDKRNFTKSITERANSKAWQDVYRIQIARDEEAESSLGTAVQDDLDLYVKLKIAMIAGEETSVVLSFKKYGEERTKL
jgi:hypothetical protein